MSKCPQYTKLSIMHGTKRLIRTNKTYLYFTVSAHVTGFAVTVVVID